MGLAPSQEPKNHGQTNTEAPIKRVEHLEPITRSDPNKSKANVWKVSFNYVCLNNTYSLEIMFKVVLIVFRNLNL